jgi:Lectin C-type domain
MTKFQPKEGYIGVKDYGHEGTWIWENSGKTATYFNWDSGEPNGGIFENCGRMLRSGKWQDVFCDVIVLGANWYTLPVVCEKLLWLETTF